MLSCSVPCLHFSISSSIWDGLSPIQSPYSRPKFIAKNAARHTVRYNRSSSIAKDQSYVPWCEWPCGQEYPPVKESQVQCILGEDPKQSFTSKQHHDYQAAVEFEWELILSPNNAMPLGKKGGKKEKYLPGKKRRLSLQSNIKGTKCQKNRVFSSNSRKVFTALSQTSNARKVQHFQCICMHSISYWQFPDPPTLLFWTSFSCTSFFDPYVRSPVTQQFSVSFQGPKNKVLQHLAWKLNSFSIKHW